MIPRSLLAVFLAAGLAVAAAPAPTPPVRVADVIDGHVHPSVCVARNGDVLAVYNRQGGGGKELLLSRSSDGGRTWSASQPIDGIADCSIYPGSLTTLSNGIVVLQWSCYHAEGQKLWRQPQFCTSGDHGRTWTKPRDLPLPDLTNYSCLRHPLLELSPNRWVLPFADRTVVFDAAAARLESFGDGRNHGLVPLVKTARGTFISGAPVANSTQPVTIPHDIVRGLRSVDQGITWQALQAFPEFGVAGYDLTVLKNDWIVLTSIVYGIGQDGEWAYQLTVSRDDGRTWESDPAVTIYNPGRRIAGRGWPRTVQVDAKTLGTLFYDLDAAQPGGPGVFFVRTPLRSLDVPAAATFLIPGAAAGAAAPVFHASGPEAAAFGEADHFPAGDRDTWQKTPYLVGSYSRYDTIFPTHRVARAKAPWNFRRADKEPDIRYDFGGQTRTLDHYFAHFPVTGLLVLQGDTILLERYQYGRTDTDRFMSASMAKSVMSLLVGIALEEGRIKSLEDPAIRYVPELKESLYGQTSVRALLQMSSGIEWDREVNGVKDNVRTQQLIDGMFDPKANPLALVAACNRRAFPPDTHFDYSAGDNEATALVLRRATGRTLSDYLGEKLWQPIGAEADATWWADPSGLEFPSTGFNAVLRDYARLGRLLAYDGAWNGRQIVPKSYILAGTTNRPGDRHLLPGAPTPYYGYGYQFWTFAGPRRMFVLRGANSQYVFVDPLSKLVLVQTAVRSEGDDSVNGKSESLALWLALVRQFGSAAKE